MRYFLPVRYHRSFAGCQVKPNCESHYCSHDRRCSCQKVRLRQLLRSGVRQRNLPLGCRRGAPEVSNYVETDEDERLLTQTAVKVTKAAGGDDAATNVAVVAIVISDTYSCALAAPAMASTTK